MSKLGSLVFILTHTVTLVQSVVVACSHRGCLSLNRSLNPSCKPWEVPAWFHFIQHASQTRQTFRIQPSWFYRLGFSDWLTLQLTFDVNPAFYWKILHTWSTLFFVLTITWQEQQLLQRYKREGAWQKNNNKVTCKTQQNNKLESRCSKNGGSPQWFHLEFIILSYTFFILEVKTNL